MLTLSERTVRRMLLVAAAALVVYWSLWFGHRPWVASSTRPAYVQFEDAFPLADGALGLGCLLAWDALRRRSPTALLWLLATGGAGCYLAGMDVLYDLEHGIYATGAGGAIEAVINVVTVAFSVLALQWAWANRVALLGVRPAGRGGAVGAAGPAQPPISTGSPTATGPGDSTRA